MTYRLRPRAQADLAEIGDYIAAEHPAAARRFIERMARKFEALAATPGMDVKRSGLPDELRMFPAGNYLVPYRQVAGGVEIVRVCHGARRWQDLL